MSALSSQLSAGAALAAVSLLAAGSSTCIPVSPLSVLAGVSSGAGPPQEGTKAGALTLGTNDGALTLREFILLLMSSSMSQVSGAPLVAISRLLTQQSLRRKKLSDLENTTHNRSLHFHIMISVTYLL